MPAGRTRPALGFWESTRPGFTRLDARRRTFPSRQCALLSNRFAARSFLPFSCGTLHLVSLATGPTAAEVAVAEPATLRAVTAARSVEPASDPFTT